MIRPVRFVVVLTALALAGAALPQGRAQTNQVIYSNGLQNGWMDWSWASDSVSNKSPVLAGFSESISVSCGGWAALYLAQTPFDVTLYTNLTFWLNGGASGGQVLTVTGTENGASQTPYTLPALAANSWKQFTVSLAEMGVADAPDFDGIWIWNNTASTIPTFYVDDIVLVAGPPPGPNPTSIIGIDAASNRTGISSLIYGTAFATSNELADLNFTMNRSGGNNETSYNWEINAHANGPIGISKAIPMIPPRRERPMRSWPTARAAERSR